MAVKLLAAKLSAVKLPTAKMSKATLSAAKLPAAHCLQPYCLPPHRAGPRADKHTSLPGHKTEIPVQVAELPLRRFCPSFDGTCRFQQSGAALPPQIHKGGGVWPAQGMPYIGQRHFRIARSPIACRRIARRQIACRRCIGRSPIACRLAVKLFAATLFAATPGRRKWSGANGHVHAVRKR